MVVSHSLQSSAAGKNRFVPAFVCVAILSDYLDSGEVILKWQLFDFRNFGISRSRFIFFYFCVFKWKLGAPTRLCAGALYACV